MDNAKLFFSSIVAVFLSSQSLNGQNSPIAHHYFSKTNHEPVAAWGYSGDNGPAHWGSLDPSYRLANSGTHQSPINIQLKSVAKAELPKLKFDYRPERIASINNGHTIQHNESPGSYMVFDKKKYALEQYHVHAPSEHEIDGKHFAMEIHFVHKSELDEVAVLAVFVQADENATVDFPNYADLPKENAENVAVDDSRNAADFLPASRSFFRYTGSFTTPPCTEKILWILMKEPIGIQPKVIERFVEILKANNRPVQSLNNRVVEESK